MYNLGGYYSGQAEFQASVVWGIVLIIILIIGILGLTGVVYIPPLSPRGTVNHLILSAQGESPEKAVANLQAMFNENSYRCWAAGHPYRVGWNVLNPSQRWVIEGDCFLR